MKRVTRSLLELGWIPAVLCSGCFLAYALWAAIIGERAGPATKLDLCRAIGQDPSRNPFCDYRSDGELRELLEAAFPLTVTDQETVHRVLDAYLVRSQATTTGGVIESYAIERTLIPPLPVYAQFSFDKYGVLQGIHIVDL